MPARENNAVFVSMKKITINHGIHSVILNAEAKFASFVTQLETPIKKSTKWRKQLVQERYVITAENYRAMVGIHMNGVMALVVEKNAENAGKQ